MFYVNIRYLTFIIIFFNLLGKKTISCYSQVFVRYMACKSAEDAVGSLGVSTLSYWRCCGVSNMSKLQGEPL